MELITYYAPESYFSENFPVDSDRLSSVFGQAEPESDDRLESAAQ